MKQETKFLTARIFGETLTSNFYKREKPSSCRRKLSAAANSFQRIETFICARCWGSKETCVVGGVNDRGKNRAAYHHSKKTNKQTAKTLKWKWCWTWEKLTCSLALLGICRVLISMSISCDGGGGRFLKQWTVLVSPNKICNDRPPMNISY